MSENSVAWGLWNILHRGDRQSTFSGIGSIPTTSIHSLCESYGESMDTVEKILIIENVVYPKIAKRAEEEREKNKSKSSSKKR